MAIKKYNFDVWPVRMDSLHHAIYEYGEPVNDDTFKGKNHEDVLASHGLGLVEMIRSGPCVFYANGACIKVNWHKPNITVHYKEGVLEGALENLEKFTNSKLQEITNNG